MRCPNCDREVATFVEHGVVKIDSHTLDGTLDGPRCPRGLKPMTPREALDGTFAEKNYDTTTHVGMLRPGSRSKEEALERGVINGRTRTEWLDLPKAPAASATKAELNAYIVDVAHLLSEAVPTMIRFADEAHTYRQRLRMADETSRGAGQQIAEAARKEQQALAQRNAARNEAQGLDRELQRANVRHAKDKRRIKALVNALAGLR